MADWNLPPLSAMGFTPYQPPPPMPDIPPEMLLQLLGNRPPPSAPLSLGGSFADTVNPPTPGALQPTPNELEGVRRGQQIPDLLFNLSGLGSLRRAGHALADRDPLLALAHGGAAMLPFRPALGMGMLGGAYGGAAASDLSGLLNPSTATAQGQPPPVAATEDGLTPAERTRRTFLLNRQRRLGDRMPEAEQTELEGLNETMVEFRRARNAAAIGAGSARATAEQEEYNRAVKRAEQARDRWLARDVRFSGTRTGNIFEETGGFAPFGFGALSGLLARTPRSAIGWGAGAGAMSAHMPLGFNATFTEPDNPIRRAFEEYSRELPPTHPRREEWRKYAEGLERENPVRREAVEQLGDPFRFALRTAVGAGEGALGGHFAHGIQSRLSGWLGGRGSPAPPPPPAPVGPAPPPPVAPPPTTTAPPPAEPALRAPNPGGMRPPAGAVWNANLQRWTLNGTIIGGPSRWTPP